jgi:glycolate oxidase iron-sulfur subunit
MKQMLEGEPVTADTQLHLDRCLTCRSCETTCPSGVRYGRLLDIGRAVTEERVERPPLLAFKRYALRKVLPHRRRFAVLLGLARLVRGILPSGLRAKLPPKTRSSTLQWPPARHVRKVLMLEGCVQPTLAPEVNIAAARVLDRLGISVVRVTAAGCCGAVAHHMSAHEETLQQLRSNIDALWPYVRSGAEAIVMTASACTAMLTDYGHLLREDPVYAQRAARVSELARDISEVVLGLRQVLQEALRQSGSNAKPGAKVAFQSPCTLQHALKVRGPVESLLGEAGFTLTHVPDSHLCCGSAGTYSILQPELSGRLLSAKVAALEQGQPAWIATANIGCHTHIRTGTAIPVRHWIELIAARLEGSLADPRG